jgi:hypothetical protein
MIKQNIIVTDKEADESLKSLSTGLVIPACEFFKSYGIGQINDNAASCNRASNAPEDVEIKLLRTIAEHPMQPSSQYATLAGISPNTFRKVRPVLKDKGLISEHKLQANARGRSAILLGPTELGKKFLSDYDGNSRSG